MQQRVGGPLKAALMVNSSDSHSALLTSEGSHYSKVVRGVKLCSAGSLCWQRAPISVLGPLLQCYKAAVCNLLGTRDWLCGWWFFSWTGLGVCGFRVIQMLYLYSVLYFYSFNIRFSKVVHNLYPLHMRFTVGFVFPWELNVTARGSVVILEMGNELLKVVLKLLESLPADMAQGLMPQALRWFLLSII